MSQTTTQHPHLKVLRGGNDELPAPAQNVILKERMRIATAFLTPDDRQKWLDYEVYTIWQAYSKTLETALESASLEFQDNLNLIRHTRDGYVTSTEIETIQALDHFMEVAAILATIAYDIISEKLTDTKPINYHKAHTSSDLFAPNLEKQAARVKTRTELARVISKKDFVIDTSTFEKEIATAVVKTFRRRLSHYSGKVNEEKLYRYLLSVFTVFNQRKLLTSSAK